MRQRASCRIWQMTCVWGIGISSLLLAIKSLTSIDDDEVILRSWIFYRKLKVHFAKKGDGFHLIFFGYLNCILSKLKHIFYSILRTLYFTN